MPEKILVSTEEINAGINQYTSAKDTKLNAIAAMQNAVKTLDATWDGPASMVFIASFNALYNNLMNSEVIMDDAITELQKVVELAEGTNTDVSDVMGQLDPGPQFSF